MDLSSEKIFYGAVELKYLFQESEGASHMVVVFSGFPKKGSPALYNYIRTLANIKAHKLFILDEYGVDPAGTYYLGQNKALTVETTTIALIAHLAGKHQIPFNRIITAGSSKGGFASLYFAIKYGFGACVSGGAQVFLGNYLMGETSVGKPIAEYIAGGLGEEERQFLNNLLPDVVRSASHFPKIFIHVGKGEPMYRNHIAPFIKLLDERQVPYFLDAADYSEHNELIHYFQPFLIEKTLLVMEDEHESQRICV